MLKVTNIKKDKKQNKLRQKTWETNHAIIKQCVLNVLQESNGFVIPTVEMIAKLTSISNRTVQKHFKSLKFEPLLHPLRVLTDEVLYNIYVNSKTNAKATELWLKVMEGWSETHNLKIQDIPPIIMKTPDDNINECS